jgi:putative peptide zinc metalloprotease protein
LTEVDKKTPIFRNDLIFQEIKNRDGSKHYIIKDPITSTYFKIGEAEFFIISKLDGNKTTGKIIGLVKDKFNEDLSEEELELFLSNLQELCFLDNDLTRQELLKRQRDASRKKSDSILGKLAYIKIKAVNPSKLFSRMIKHVRFFFTATFVWIAAAMMFVAFLITLYNGKAMADGFIGILNLRGLIILYFTILVVGVFHEFAHGLTCHRFGGEVREMGFLLIYLQPAFYCNISDAWLFPKKSHRLWVSLAGGFFQFFIWALAVFVWRLTEPGVLINDISVAVMFFAGVSNLFNFNPLLKYDGYYLLSDYLEIPNLRDKAKNYWRALVDKVIFRDPAYWESITPRDRRIYFYYGIFSFFYIVFIVGYLLYLAGWYLIDRLGGTGLLIFVALLVFLFRKMIMDAARGIKRFFKTNAAFFLKRRTLSITILTILFLAVISVVTGWELRVKGELVLDPTNSLLLKYDNMGYVQLINYSADNPNASKQREISVLGGDYSTTSLVPLINPDEKVERGQTIAMLVNTETQKYIDEYTAALDKATEELGILKKGARPEEIESARNEVSEMEAKLDLASQNLRRTNEMMQKKVIARKVWEDAYADSVVWASRLKSAQSKLELLQAGARPEEIRAKQAEIDKLKGQIDFHKKQQEAYDIKSTINGVVLSVDTGETVCEIAELDTLKAIIMLSEKELADIKLDQKVKFKVRSYPEMSFYGTVYRIGKKIVEQGGKRVFMVECRIPNNEHILKPGMTGVANIYCGKRKLSSLIYRKFFRTIRTEFWDWFDWL